MIRTRQENEEIVMREPEGNETALALAAMVMRHGPIEFDSQEVTSWLADLTRGENGRKDLLSLPMLMAEDLPDGRVRLNYVPLSECPPRVQADALIKIIAFDRDSAKSPAGKSRLDPRSEEAFRREREQRVEPPPRPGWQPVGSGETIRTNKPKYLD
jgi:hypothetical protein